MPLARRDPREDKNWNGWEHVFYIQVLHIILNAV